MTKNDAYVYQHRNTTTNEIFYVGMSSNNKGGNYKRQHVTSRNCDWKKVVENTDYKVEIVKENLSIGEATDLEAQLITQYKDGGFLTNIQQIDVDESFVYTLKEALPFVRKIKGIKTFNIMIQLCMLCDYNKNSLLLNKSIKDKIKNLLTLSDAQLYKGLKVLIDNKGITKENELITINSSYFWKGDLEKLKRITK